MLTEVAIASLSNDFPELGHSTHGGDNIILPSPVVNQAKMASLNYLTFIYLYH
jgi:hypothetical protein